MTILASDSFTRADFGNLDTTGTIWGAGAAGACPIVSNEASATAGHGITFQLYVGATWPNDQYATLKVGTGVESSSDNGVGPAVRITGAPGADGDLIFMQSNAVEIKVYVRVGGTYTQVGIDGPSVATGDILYLEVQGSTVIAKKNGTSVCGSPISIAGVAGFPTAGRAGFWIAANASINSVDDWAGGDFSGGGGPVVTDYSDVGRTDNRPGRGPFSYGKFYVQDTTAYTPPVLAIAVHPLQQSGPAAGSITFIGLASGNPPAYQWQSAPITSLYTNVPGTWSDISGATSATYTRTVASADNGMWFRLKATDSTGTVFSFPARMFVTGLGVTAKGSLGFSGWAGRAKQRGLQPDQLVRSALKTAWQDWLFGASVGRVKVWNGSAWVLKTTKTWNGSAWVVKTVKWWNGSAWTA